MTLEPKENLIYSNYIGLKCSESSDIDELTLNVEIAGYDYGCRIDCTILNGLATVNDYKIILMDLFSNKPNPSKITIIAKPDFGT